MRLFDADKLQVKHYLQRTEHPIGYEGTQAVYDYTDVLAYDIESAETVEAIPVEWIKEWYKKHVIYLDENKPTGKGLYAYEQMIYDWKKKNEKR